MKFTEKNRSTRGEKPVPVPLCPPQIPQGLTPGSKPGLRGERPATNRLSHGWQFSCWKMVFGFLIAHLVVRWMWIDFMVG
jgi:hypothetical protein